jgi:hypothetical protein
VLILGEEIDAVGEQVEGLLTGHLGGIARIVIRAQPDGAARRHHERFDEVGHKAKALVHPATMPATAGTTRTKDARGADRREARKPVSSGCWLPGP